MTQKLKQEWAEGRLRVELRGPVLVATVTRPEVRNALDIATMMALGDLVEALARRPDVEALVIAGDGERAFVAGGDLAQLAGLKGREGGVALSSTMGDTLKRLVDLPLVTIAAIGGDAFGGGVELALACDMRVMERSSHLALTQARFGLTTGWGGAARLVALVGYSRALELMLTMRRLGAVEAEQMGLANRVVDDGKALEGALALAERVASLRREVSQGIKAVALAATRGSDDDATHTEREVFATLWASPYHEQQVRAFLARSPSRPGRGTDDGSGA